MDQRSVCSRVRLSNKAAVRDLRIVIFRGVVEHRIAIVIVCWVLIVDCLAINVCKRTVFDYCVFAVLEVDGISLIRWTTASNRVASVLALECQTIDDDVFCLTGRIAVRGSDQQDRIGQSIGADVSVKATKRCAVSQQTNIGSGNLDAPRIVCAKRPSNAIGASREEDRSTRSDRIDCCLNGNRVIGRAVARCAIIFDVHGCVSDHSVSCFSQCHDWSLRCRVGDGEC